MKYDLKSLTDEELMVAYQEGNDRAFSVLYNRHSGKLFGYLKNKLKDSHLAEDVFQATFLKLHRNRSRYDPSFPFLPWLFTVCKTVMIDQTRKKGVFERMEMLWH
jgi:RNA polymerase sigma-70 factor (ECF subfamily)